MKTIHRFAVLLILLVSFLGTPVQAELEKMSEESMRGVNGRAQLMELNIHDGNVSDGAVYNQDLTFVNMDINATVTGLADRQNCEPPNCDRTHSDGDGVNNVCSDNTQDQCSLNDGSTFKIDTLKLGHYDDGNKDWSNSQYSAESCGWGCTGTNDFDIKATSLEIPNHDRDQIYMDNPYITLAYENMNDGDPATNRLAGIRIGFDRVQGGLTLNIDKISGTFRGSDFGTPCWSGGCVSISEHRSTNTKITSMFSKLSFGTNYEFGDNDGWTEDFWLSFQERDIFYERHNPAFDWNNQTPAFGTGETEFHEDGKGFWMHATDDIAGGIT